MVYLLAGNDDVNVSLFPWGNRMCTIGQLEGCLRKSSASVQFAVCARTLVFDSSVAESTTACV